MDKFSILTACSNNLRFLDQYFQSVLAQQYPELEIIFVDDCSNDGSLEFAQSIKDSRVKIFSNKAKQYCSGTYAKALHEATGSICGVVDADDVLAIGAVEKIVSLYEKNPDLLYIYTQHYWCDENLKVQKRGVSGPPKGSLAQAATKGVHAFSHWRTFRRKVMELGEIFPSGLRYAVDKNMGFVLEDLGNGGYYPESLYYYRYYKGNMSLTSSKEQRVTAMKMAHEKLKKRRHRKAYPIRIVK